VATTVTPFLMFQGDAEDAMNLYVSLFPDSEILEIERYGADGPGMNGDVLQARVRLAGQELICIDSPTKHPFSFTPSTSLFVIFDDEQKLGGAFSQLAEGGQVLMPLASYPFARAFGWVQDRFGVSWQLSMSH
jgi:predicted 3-demethylubiquinone-9 3-methyltransferase (glyoxalase superfamily)